MTQWYYCKQGEQFGPVQEADLKALIRAGSLSSGDIVWCDGMVDWRPVSDMPEFGAPASSAQIRDVPPPGRTSQVQPHRSQTILVLGILGLAVCFICGIVAWAMGSEDLRKMDQGRMDPSGRDETKLGWILGIVGTLVGGGGAVVGIIILLATVAGM